ncbi:UNVERIFIED_CONTAM: hypothetical protein PYX00_004955 [Menopon gallinae]|uniref:Golgi membrane protein 2 n=1 Tax=Menopon gallinae TaxID=328185 RepID=A0AAW2I7V7_9NEOP
MSVRGSKNKTIFYVVGACSLVFVIIFYHNESQRLEAMQMSYERCHLNEESLSAQLQVNLEYKIRLEKSLQQEKSDHAQTKEEFQKKLEDERQTREHENLESINKFSALKEQCNFMQHGCDVVKDNYKKLKHLQSLEADDRKHLEEVVDNLRKELNLLRDTKEKVSDTWKEKMSALERNNSLLQDENRKLREKVEIYEKKRTSPSDVKLPNNMPLGPLFRKSEKNDSQLHLPNYPREGVLSPSGVAVLGDDKVPIAPMPQPRQESSSMKDLNAYDGKEHVAPKPEELYREGANGMVIVQDVLRPPEILRHNPDVHNYKKQLRESEKNNHGGEVGDEDEAIAKNAPQNHLHHWREGEFKEQPVAVNPMGNEIPRNQGYQYPVEDEGRKEEGEDDDDMDPMEYQNVNDKPNEMKENELKPVMQMPFGGKHDSVMLQPK